MRLTKEEKAVWLENWKQSGKKAWTFAKENGLVPQTFVKWTKAEKETKSCFVEVSAQVIEPLSQAPQIILIEKGELKIHIPLTVGRDALRAVIEGLGVVL